MLGLNLLVFESIDFIHHASEKAFLGLHHLNFLNISFKDLGYSLLFFWGYDVLLNFTDGD